MADVGSEDFLSRFPQEFVVGTSPRPTRYLITRDRFAVLDEVTIPSGEIELEMDDGRVKVIRGTPPLELIESLPQSVTAVFQIDEHGPLAVPTGRIFVRVPEGSRLEDHQRDIEDAGFRIKDVLGYAPHAGWLEAKSKTPCDALTHFMKLQELEGVEAVEPQMLTLASRK